MDMKTIIKSTDVTDFLKFLVTIIGVMDVDSDGYVKNLDGTPVTTTVDGKDVNVLLYKDVISDNEALIVNPFYEGLQDSQAQTWFYFYNYTFFSVCIDTVVSYLLKLASMQKTAAPAEKKGTKKKLVDDAAEAVARLPLPIMNILSPIVEDMDPKVIEEYETISKNMDPRDILKIYYNKTHRLCTVRCSFFEDDQSIFTDLHIRKKTLQVLKTLYMGIFGISSPDDLKKFDVKAPSSSNCAKLESTLRCYYGLYNQINELLEYTSGTDFALKPVDLDTYAKHLDNIREYHIIAKWQKSAATPAVPTPTRVASSMPQPAASATPPWNTDTQQTQRTANGVPIPTGMQQQPMPQQMMPPVGVYPQQPGMMQPSGYPMMQVQPGQQMMPGMMPQGQMMMMPGYPQMMQMPQRPMMPAPVNGVLPMGNGGGVPMPQQMMQPGMMQAYPQMTMPQGGYPGLPGFGMR